MNINPEKDNGITTLALEFKRLRYNEDRASRKRLDAIILELSDKTKGILRRIQKGINGSDQCIIQELFYEQLLLALDKWKGKSPFLPYALCYFKSINRHYATEISAVNRCNLTGKYSFDELMDSIPEDVSYVEDEKEEEEPPPPKETPPPKSILFDD